MFGRRSRTGIQWRSRICRRPGRRCVWCGSSAAGGCREPACGAGTWTEQRPDVALARAALTTRAGLWATREVGAEFHTVAYVARQLGVTWHTVMDAVAYWGRVLIDDPDRAGQTTAAGVDETKFLAARHRRLPGRHWSRGPWDGPHPGAMTRSDPRLAHDRLHQRTGRGPRLADQEDQTRRYRVLILRRLRAPHPARLRRLQVDTPRHPNPAEPRSAALLRWSAGRLSIPGTRRSVPFGRRPH